MESPPEQAGQTGPIPGSSQGTQQDPDAFPPVPRWVYDPPKQDPPVLHEEVYEQAQKDGSTVRGGYVVIDKPAGLLAVPGIGEDKQDCARSRVHAMYPFATGPMTVHRLDVATSGVLVLALDPATHRNLSVQFERRRITKRYLALVEGHLDPALGDGGVIQTPMRKDLDRSPAQLVDFDRGRDSQTRWRVLARETLLGEPVTRIEFEPVTGRTHQLRVHAADMKPGAVRVVGPGPSGEPPVEFADGMGRGLGAPIVGDELYAGRMDLGDRLMLHAWTITLNHPVSGKMMSVRAPEPF
ncbi:MAG: RluA family pseudouridine synthase [Phycisphaerales bacterium JB040]